MTVNNIRLFPSDLDIVWLIFVLLLHAFWRVCKWVISSEPLGGCSEDNYRLYYLTPICHPLNELLLAPLNNILENVLITRLWMRSREGKGERETKKKDQEERMAQKHYSRLDMLLRTKLGSRQMRVRRTCVMLRWYPSKTLVLLVCLCSASKTSHLNHLVWYQSSFAVQMTAQLCFVSGFEGISLKGMVLLTSGDPGCCWCVHVHSVWLSQRQWISVFVCYLYFHQVLVSKSRYPLLNLYTLSYCEMW